MRKKILVLTLLTMVLVFALTAPAFAERLGGYWRATLSVGTRGATTGFATGVGINPDLNMTVKGTGHATAYLDAYGFTGLTASGLTDLGKPHGGYSTTSGKCKVCHAVHGAGEYASNYLATRYYTGTNGKPASSANSVYGTGGVVTEALLRTTKSQACEFCHVGTQAFADPDLYASPDVQNTYALSNYENSTANVVTSPPAILNPIRSGHYAEHEELATGYEGCVSCHAVHGGDTLAGSTILKNDPARGVVAYEAVNGGFGSIKGAVKNQHQFCEDCHNGTNYTPADVGGVAQAPVELTSTAQFRENWPNCSCHDSAQSWLSDTTNQLGAGFFANHDRRSHINTMELSAEGVQIAWSPTVRTTEGPTAGTNACATCHKGNTNPFPHFSSTNIELIGQYTATTQIDGVCVTCHWDRLSAPTAGVGITF